MTTSYGPTSVSATTPLAALDDDDARAAPRPDPQGPPDRSLPDVRARAAKAATPRSRCSRAAASSSTTLATPTGNESIDGNIYLGRVQNVLPGMEAAFVDIGTPKNGVLYRGDVAFDKADVEGGSKPKIERMLKNGQIDPRARSPRTRSRTRAPASPRR